MVQNGRMCMQKLCRYRSKATVLVNHMHHFLPCLFTSHLTRICWNKPDLTHFSSPRFVMIAFSRRLPNVMLPCMHHFMCKRGQYVNWLPSCKMSWVQCYFIGNFLWICRPGKPITGEISICTFMPLDCYEARW